MIYQYKMEYLIIHNMKKKKPINETIKLIISKHIAGNLSKIKRNVCILFFQIYIIYLIIY